MVSSPSAEVVEVEESFAWFVLATLTAPLTVMPLFLTHASPSPRSRFVTSTPPLLFVCDDTVLLSSAVRLTPSLEVTARLPAVTVIKSRYAETSPRASLRDTTPYILLDEPPALNAFASVLDMVGGIAFVSVISFQCSKSR